MEESYDDLVDDLEFDGTDDSIDLPEIGEDRAEALAMGLDGELKESFDKAIHDDSPSTDSVSIASSKSDLDELPVQYEIANTLLKRVYTELNETGSSGIPNQLVLGAPQYAVLYPWAKAEHGKTIEDVLPVAEVIVVPGPMVHAGRRKVELLEQYVERTSVDDG